MAGVRPVPQGPGSGTGAPRELDPETSEAALALILRRVASPPQISGFLLVGRARTESFRELAAYARALRRFVRELEPPPGPPVVTVADRFDGKLHTFNVGAASLVAAAAGGRVLMLGGEGVPPKFGHTTFDTLKRFGLPIPDTPGEVVESLPGGVSPRRAPSNICRSYMACYSFAGRWCAAPRSTWWRR